MKKIELMFYPTNPSPENVGLKHVLWEIEQMNEDSPIVKHDWGFGYWNGQGWDMLELPAGWFAVVKYWANTVDPELLLKEKGKIISLG